MEWRNILSSPYCPLPPSHKHVLTTMARYGDKWGDDIFPSQREIAYRAGVTPKCVCDVMKRAARDGWILRQQLGAFRGYKRHLYDLCVPSGVLDLVPMLNARFWLPPYDQRIVMRDGKLVLEGRS